MTSETKLSRRNLLAAAAVAPLTPAAAVERAGMNVYLQELASGFSGKASYAHVSQRLPPPYPYSPREWAEYVARTRSDETRR